MSAAAAALDIADAIRGEPRSDDRADYDEHTREIDREERL